MSSQKQTPTKKVSKTRAKSVKGEYTTLEDADYYVIRNFDLMPPFFMTVLSATDHWLFISSNGALSAGRINPEYALFPYYTDDKITDSVGVTGAKVVFRVEKEGRMKIWEPFNQHFAGNYDCTSNLYKNREGNKLVFEEINHDLGLTYQYSWSFSEKYGIVKESALFNNVKHAINVQILDGIQNLIPYGVSSQLQNDRSTLIDAYKVAEWDDKRDLAIYSLSSMIVDKAEPSEALKATTVWAAGIEYDHFLLSSRQINQFKHTGMVHSEPSIKAEKGAFFIQSNLTLKAGVNQKWVIVGEVNQSARKISVLRRNLQDREAILNEVLEDVKRNKAELRKKIGLADGIQLSADRYATGRHFSNVLFNIMRGGTFDEQYEIETKDFIQHVKEMNRLGYLKLKTILSELPETISYHQLRYFLTAARHKDTFRYYLEYLPLSFSRRHGDPSRPWNFFSIELKTETGEKHRNYEGNWRDIFQNWEALAFSYPEYCLGMIAKFVNASTIDGYNPYRITRSGIDWEVIDPNDPWSHIGYWGDHQVIYLSKLLEISFNYHPRRLQQLLEEPIFTYANVPYRIKGYDAILSDPKHTITYDTDLAAKIATRVAEIGSDGKLVMNKTGDLERVNLTEKILVMVLTKLYNFIPEAGIWLNTQRPEWNDANNALVGNGISMVTLSYLRRFLSFAEKLFANLEKKEVEINKPVVDLLDALSRGFQEALPSMESIFTDEQRRDFMDNFGVAGEHYRTTAYAGFTQHKRKLTYSKIIEFFQLSRKFLERSIDLNKRSDGLYHSYNLLTLSSTKAQVGHLYKMLEGQVSVLSAKYLPPEEALNVLNALKKSNMFREDQYSYLLYPDRTLPTFLEKNTIHEEDLKGSKLAKAMITAGDYSIIEKDTEGKFHFNGNFHNADDLELALDNLENPEWRRHARAERGRFLEAFENVFNHKSFTGRSSAFYGYEGLGSIYWHMVSKLILAIQENILLADELKASDITKGHLIEHYYESRAGTGLNKSPEVYGAFPTDAYSHTPKYAGAKQPGMTGQVKEDIINRWGELGVYVYDGCLGFKPLLLRRSEFIEEAATLSYYSCDSSACKIEVPAGGLGFTYCQVPIIYKSGKSSSMTVQFDDGSTGTSKQLMLDQEDSKEVFKRTGKIVSIEVTLEESILL